MEKEFSIVNNETAGLIVKICFLTNDLKQIFWDGILLDGKRYVRCDDQILKQMDAVLASNIMSEFSKKLDDFIEMTDSFIKTYNSPEYTFSEKTSIQNTLQKLSFSLKQLQQNITISNV